MQWSQLKQEEQVEKYSGKKLSGKTLILPHICSTITIFYGSDFIQTVSIIKNSLLDEINQKKLG